jgi:hypothetical protein
MLAGHEEWCSIASGEKRRGRIEAVGLAGALVGVNPTGREVVRPGTHVCDARWRDAHGEELKNLERDISESERKDVLVPAGWVITWESGNVGGIVEVASRLA